MTLLELFKLLKRRFTFIAATDGIVLMACAIYFLLFVHTQYTASASLVINSNFNFASSAASSASSDASTDEVTVTSTGTSSTSSIVFTAVSSDADTSIMAANAAARHTVELVKQSFPEVITQVFEASKATDTTKNFLKFGTLALAASLFLAVFLIVVEDTFVQRIHDWRGIAATGLPYLGSTGGDSCQRERLAAAVRFAGSADGELPASICLAPVGNTAGATIVGRQLASAYPEHTTRIVVANPLSKGAGVILAARKAGKCVLVVEAEKSTFPDLETLMRELEICGVAPAGFVFVEEGEKLETE